MRQFDVWFVFLEVLLIGCKLQNVKIELNLTSHEDATARVEKAKYRTKNAKRDGICSPSPCCMFSMRSNLRLVEIQEALPVRQSLAVTPHVADHCRSTHVKLEESGITT